MSKGFLTGTLVLILLTAFGIGSAFAQREINVADLVTSPYEGATVDFYLWNGEEFEYVGFDVTDENGDAVFQLEIDEDDVWQAHVILPSGYDYVDPPDGWFPELDFWDWWTPATITPTPKK